MPTTSLVRRAWSAARGSGYGYEPHDEGARWIRDGVDGYFIDYRPKIASHALHPCQPLYAADLAQLALGWWEQRDTGDSASQFLALCERIEATAENHAGGLLWRYDVDVPKYGVKGVWYSGMAQGQIASVFVRAALLSGDERYVEVARSALQPLLRPGPERLVTMTPHGPVLEEGGPCDPPSHILNGWIFALWGVWEVAVTTADKSPNQLFEDTTACLLRLLERYDLGWWSKYSLFPHPLADAAKPFYHRLHILQLRILDRLTGRPDFGRVADRWASYDTKLGATRAIASKVPFVALNALARRRDQTNNSRTGQPRASS
jgi:hypothetical protein